MQKTLKEFTEVELKALAFDTLVLIEQNQKNLQIINNELQSRAKPTGTDVQVEASETTGTETPVE